MSPVLLILTLILCSSIGITTVILNRFRKKTASIVSLLAGFLPWLFILAYEDLVPSNSFGVAIGMYGASPLFLLSFFLFGFGEKTLAEKRAAIAALFGAFLGGCFSLLLIDILSRAE